MTLPRTILNSPKQKKSKLISICIKKDFLPTIGSPFLIEKKIIGKIVHIEDEKVTVEINDINTYNKLTSHSTGMISMGYKNPEKGEL